MIVLFTDFGWQGPYVGQLKAVLQQHSPETPVVDLMHDVPAFNIKAAAYLLASLVKSFPKGTVFLAVVDPGVGSERMPCVVKTDDYWFVGPDNGLFDIVLKRARVKEKWEITWRPEYISSSFHGRDLFAPIAAEIASGKIHNSPKLSCLELVSNDWPEELNEIIYIDHFGNCMTGLRGESLDKKQVLNCKNSRLHFAETFSEVPPGEAFWYINSSGLCEVSVNQGRADQLLGLIIGDKVNYQGCD